MKIFLLFTLFAGLIYSQCDTYYADIDGDGDGAKSVWCSYTDLPHATGGNWEDAGWETNGCGTVGWSGDTPAGHLTYGPYISTDPGTTSVTWNMLANGDVDNDGTQIATIDIYDSTSGELLAWQDININEEITFSVIIMSSENNKVSLTDVFISYQSTIKSFISRIVKPDDINDIVQETFVRSYEANLKKEIKYAKSYMLKTAKNIAFNHNAKWDIKYNDSIEDFVEPPVELSSNLFEDDYESKERFLSFCRATDQLSGPVRKCFILKKVYGLSQKEIAHYLQLSESTVEKHVAKGLLKSVQYMQQMHYNVGQNSVTKEQSKTENVSVKNVANK